MAQYNVANARHRLDSAEMREFFALVRHINAVADASPGFVWRSDENPADPQGAYRLRNLSVWQDVDSLREFTYRSAHIGVFRDRAQWFEPSAPPHVVLWWIPAGQRPGFAAGETRLDLLRGQGATAEAFDFRTLFAPPA